MMKSKTLRFYINSSKKGVSKTKKMKVTYIGPDIGVDGLRNGNEYEVLEVDKLTGYLRIIDESGEDYLYSPTKPRAIADEYAGGKFEIIEDDENKTLASIIV